MEVSEKEFIKLINENLSQTNHFSCIISYENSEELAWYTALSIGERIIDCFETGLSKQIDIHLCFKIDKIIFLLNKMKENDVVLLSIDNKNIKTLSSYIASETFNKKKNILFISNKENSLIRRFTYISGIVINVNSLSKKLLNCVIEISERGKRELKLKLPDISLVNKYHELKVALLKESIRKQVPELDNNKF